MSSRTGHVAVPNEWHEHSKDTRAEVYRWLRIKREDATKTANAWISAGISKETQMMHALYALAFGHAEAALRELERKGRR